MDTQRRGDLFERPRPDALTLVWALFATAIFAFLTESIFSPNSVVLSHVLAVLSLVTCGLAWLLSQCLFSDISNPAAGLKFKASIACVGLLFGITAVLVFAPVSKDMILIAYLGLAQSMLSSTVLLLTLFEIFNGFGAVHSTEKRFRFAFATGYGVILGVSLVANLAEFEVWAVTIQASLAAVALIGATLAVRYRHAHQITTRNSARQSGSTAIERDPELAQRLTELALTDRPYLNPDIRTADVARQLRVPSYRISRVIATDLGYRNFNHWLNAHRIAAAKLRLADAADRSESIVNIAMDCGFASLGPFNRAFKAQTGQTPSAYRRSQMHVS